MLLLFLLKKGGVLELYLLTTNRPVSNILRPVYSQSVIGNFKQKTSELAWPGFCQQARNKISFHSI